MLSDDRPASRTIPVRLEHGLLHHLRLEAEAYLGVEAAAVEVDKDDGYVLVARLAAGEAASVARARLRTVASARLRERGALSAVAMELDRSGWIFLVGAGGGEGRRGRDRKSVV